MNNKCKSAALGFGMLFLYALLVNAPLLIIYGCLLCCITGILCHDYGYRKLDIFSTSTFIILNMYAAYKNKYINSASIATAIFGSIMYLTKNSNHVLYVQTPFFISIFFMIQQSIYSKT